MKAVCCCVCSNVFVFVACTIFIWQVSDADLLK